MAVKEHRQNPVPVSVMVEVPGSTVVTPVMAVQFVMIPPLVSIVQLAPREPGPDTASTGNVVAPAVFLI